MRKQSVLALVLAAAAGCTALPTASTEAPDARAPAVDTRTAMSLQPGSVKFSRADFEQMRKMIPDRITPEDAKRLLIQPVPDQIKYAPPGEKVTFDPAAIRTENGRKVQQFWGGYGWGGLGFRPWFYPFAWGGYSLYWPYTLAAGLWSPFGYSPWSWWGGNYWPWSPFWYGGWGGYGPYGWGGYGSYGWGGYGPYGWGGYGYGPFW